MILLRCGMSGSSIDIGSSGGMLFSAEAGCPSRDGSTGSAGTSGGTGASGSLCFFGLTSKTINNPTTRSNRSRRIFRFVVRRW